MSAIWELVADTVYKKLKGGKASYLSQPGIPLEYYEGVFIVKHWVGKE